MIPPNLQAVFMDRDGVLNKYVRGDYIRAHSEIVLLPGAAEAVRLLNDRNVPVFIISNQQGVGKGLMTIEALRGVENELRQQLLDAAGATFVNAYYCTHLASDECTCRKPKPGMILEAAKEYKIDVSRSVMIGDSFTDIVSGNAAGVAATMLLMSGGTEIVTVGEVLGDLQPTFIARDLLAAVSHLVNERPA